jgi:putative aldouronate transport system substrate-binding protein
MAVTAMAMAIACALAACGGNSIDNSADIPAQTSVDAKTPEQKTEAPTDAQNAEASYLDNMTEPGTYPLVKEQVALRLWMSPPSWIEDLDTNWFTQYYSEKTNIKFEFVRNNMEDHWDKLNLTLASQTNMPDVFLSWGINNAQQMAYGNQGVFLRLNDYIDKYGYATKQVFAYNSAIEKSAVAPNGSIYGLPAVNECFHCSMPYKLWVDQTWLDNLGIEMPKTTEDFYQMLKRFKEEDANGNGDLNDEIPMSKATWSGDIDMFLMNAFAYNGGGERWFVDNGVIKQNAITPEWREGLRYLNKLYSDGLVDQEFTIADNETVKLLTGDENGNRVGVVACGAIQFVDTASPVKENFVAIPPLTGPNGVHYAAQYPIGMGQGNFVITNQCEIPEIAFRFGDSIYQLFLDGDYNLNGPEGEAWEYAQDGELGLDGKPANYKILKSGQEPNNFTWSEGINTFLSADFRNSMAADMTIWDTKHEVILYNETKGKYYGNGPAELLPSLFYTEAEQERVSELSTLINKTIGESIVQFMTGARDINSDSEWNSYVSELKKMGYDDERDLVQAAYDRVK